MNLIKRFGVALGFPSGVRDKVEHKVRLVTGSGNANVHWPWTKRDPRRVKAERRARNKINRRRARYTPK